MSHETDDFDELIAETNAIFETLLSDLPDLKRGIMPSDPQSLRRHYCRGLFAWIEGHLESVKRQFLFDQWWQVDERTEDKLWGQRQVDLPDGSTHFRKSFLPLIKDLRLTFRVIAEAQGLEPLVADDDPGWELLIRSAQIRNRVVHPKRSADLNITNDEIACLRRSAHWYLDKATYVLTENAKETLRQLDVQLKLAEEYFRREAEEQGTEYTMEVDENERAP